MKRQTICNSPSDDYIDATNTNNGHVQTTQAMTTMCPDTSLNFLNLTNSITPPQVTSTAPTNTDETSMIAAYQSNYTFSTNIDANTDASTIDYMTNSNVMTTTTNNSLNQLSAFNAPPSGSHQRRGSLQLWQFLVALLDEPASR